jgi:hypothetical protein
LEISTSELVMCPLFCIAKHAWLCELLKKQVVQANYYLLTNQM